MKWYFGIIGLVLVLLLSCNASQGNKVFSDTKNPNNDTIRISNKELDYEIIIYDPGFKAWLLSNARPRGYYSQSYLEARNRIWVLEWNLRANLPLQYRNLYEMRIDYDSNTNFGYEVNYLLFNYLVYFQQKNNVNLGGFSPRI
jgi:hypothetical protein